ncbi:3-isopropylmalate dehydratase large subunit [Hyphomonas sp.]|uniref:3-isopropylmalate dehydratase large subunit n=1 Tax=Hyphomonas sp. TaxID=87 RepID=UPI0032D8B8A0
MSSSEQRSSAPRTLYEKLWDAHLVAEENGEAILYIDLHMLHEVTSPQAFAGLAEHGRKIRRPDLTLAMADHCVPTTGQSQGIGAVEDEQSRAQLAMLNHNSAAYGIEHYTIGDIRNGIVHVVGPEQGRTQPGMTIVCGDSHTSTHGAFGALAFGIGTSEIEHVLATQAIRQRKSGNLRVTVNGSLAPGVTAKDLALTIVSELSVDGATGHVIEYCGDAIRALSMEGRMTLCNMSIEAGARAGLVAPDDVTYDYLKARMPAETWAASLSRWKKFHSDPGARFDHEIILDASTISPVVSWGINPAQSIAIEARIPEPSEQKDQKSRAITERALSYMALQAGSPIAGTPIDRVFIGSCTNGRIEDLRAAAAVLKGRTVHPRINAIVVPGSGMVRHMAEQEGLHTIFLDAGFEWREPGCSMCAAMNNDRLTQGQRCASTSNRNFENRQGPGGRTHLMSPAMAAAAAVTGEITDFRTLP